jgi:gliding motility-associated-like protein
MPWKKVLMCLMLLVLLFVKGTGQTGMYISPDTIVYIPGQNIIIKKAGPQAGGSIPVNSTNNIENKSARTTAGITLNITATDATCWKNGSIIVSASGGTPPYTYDLNGWNSWYQNGYFPNLTPWTHTVSAKDATGAIASTQVTIGNNLAIPQLTHSGYTNPSSCLADDGSITVAATGGLPPYTYSMDNVNWQTSNVFTGLCRGIYNFIVKDANGCTNASHSQFFGQSCAFGFGFSHSASSCNNTGSLNISGVGSTGPFSYSLDGVNFVSSGTFNNLPPATHIIYIKDGTGKMIKYGFQIYPSCPVVVATTRAACNQNDGTITATAQDGLLPFTYSLDGIDYQTSNVFTNLASGYYYVTAKDASGRTSSTSTFVANNCPAVTLTYTNETCNSANGTITCSGFKGTLPYEYSIDGTNFQSSNVFTGLAAGPYTITIKDANGYTGTNTATIKNNCLTVSATPVDATCGLKNGNITLLGSGGTAPYQFSIDGINFQSSNMFTGLAPGPYTITIKDLLSVTNTTTVTINNIINASCVTVSAVAQNEFCGQQNGFIVATGSSGTTPYRYSLDGVSFQTGNTFTQLAAGPYTITVKDANNATSTTPVTVNHTAGPQILANATAAGCSNQDGFISITGTGGTSPLQYSIGGIQYQSNSSFNNLATGNYTAYVKDFYGCLAAAPVNVPLVNSLTVDAGADENICEGAGVTLSATSNGNSYAWSPDATLSNVSIQKPIASPSSTTKYYVTATWGPCTKQDLLMVFVMPAPQAIAGAPVTICYGQNATLQGGGGVSCSWLPATWLNNSQDCNPTVNKPTNNITYQLTVTDANGCKSLQPASFTVNVTPPAKVFAGNDTAIVANLPFQLQAIDVNNSGFSTYSWSPAFGLNNPGSKSPLVTIDNKMTYTVTATTIAGCEGTDNININVYKESDIYVPNAFTPNGDGRNDILKAIPVGIKEFRYFTLYNRWGQRVFYMDRPDKGWDGKVNGLLQGADTFVWQAAGVDYTGKLIERKGTVTLIR